MAFVGFGAHTRPRGAARAEQVARSRDMLCRTLGLGTTIALTGAGCTAPLGYPGWRGLVEEVVELTAAELTNADAAEAGRFESFLRRLSGESLRADELTFMLSMCQSALSSATRPGPIERYFAERFARATRETPHEPYGALLELKLTRFITTNYDLELERALRVRQKSVRSFTPAALDQLVRIGLARVPESEVLVFHCHGSVDDVDSIIASEADYQRRYFAHRTDPKAAFLQSLDIVLGSNPILFVGFGLGDEELLRPLRMFSALEPDRKVSRPLFALLPEPAEGAHRDRHDFLYERFGVHAIPYVEPPDLDADSRAKELCAALRSLRAQQVEWSRGWLSKPAFRRVDVRARPPAPYRHYGVEPTDHETLGRRRVDKTLARIEAAFDEGCRVVGLDGAGGTGKSWHALTLMRRLANERRRFDGLFFWSSYYADDALTGMERLLRYLGADLNADRGSRIEQLREALERRRVLIVLDGLERLLHETGRTGEGKTYNSEMQTVLQLFTSERCRSTLLLTSRLRPRELPEGELVRYLRMQRIHANDIREDEPFAQIRDPRGVSALCSLVEGHAYALLLAAQVLRRRSLPLEVLQRRLARTPPDRRVSRMIREAVHAADQACGGMARDFLERLAVFMSPVTREILTRCYDEAVQQHDPARLPSPDALLDQLLEFRLVFRVEAGPDEPYPPAFTVHPTVRSFVFQEIDGVEHDELPNFTLPGFTSGNAAVHPGSAMAADKILKLLSRLSRDARRALRSGEFETAVRLCRGAFGVVRSRMESNTAPRWTSYDRYLALIIDLANLVKLVSLEAIGESWHYCDTDSVADIEDARAPLFSDEIAWLYNDLGLTLCSQGAMQDAYAVWEQGYAMNRVVDGRETAPRRILQSQLHLAHTFLELGQLPVAAQYLEETARTNVLVNDRDYAGRVLGYQALIEHLRGNLEEADQLYARSIAEFRTAEVGGNPRAESFFLRHRAALAITRGDAEAAEYVATSRALAAAGRYPDLEAYAGATRAGLQMAHDQLPEAMREFRVALSLARTCGVRRLEAEIEVGLARLALRLGDGETARTHAVRCLCIANELGLGIRQTAGLVVLGDAFVHAGQTELGIAYLELGRERAMAQEYWLRGQEANEKLVALGRAGVSFSRVVARPDTAPSGSTRSSAPPARGHAP